MKRFSEQFKKQATTVKLNAAMRSDLRARVVSYMEYHPLPVQPNAERIVSKKKKTNLESFQVITIPYGIFARWTGAFTVLVVLVVPFWAERAVPGDTLYPIKVRFNEEIRSTLSFTPAQKIEWETSRLSRRIAEARLLASEGRLTEAMEVRVAEAVRTHTENVQREIDAIRIVDVDEASLAALEIAATLDVHASNFQVSDAGVALMTANQSVRTIIADAITAARDGKSEQYSSSTIPALAKLQARLEVHTTRLYELRTSLTKQGVKVELREIDRRIADIERAIVAASLLADSDELAARFAMVDVLQRSQRVLVFIANLDAASSASIDSIAPIELTTEEKIAQLKEQELELDQLVVQIQFGLLADTEETSILEKVAFTVTSIQLLQASATSNMAINELDIARTEIESALGLARDAVTLLKQADISLVLPPTGDVVGDITATTSPATTTDDGTQPAEGGIADNISTTTTNEQGL